MTDVVQKLWGFCHTLRHDGVDYGDYIEQITYLLFLKMADERGVELPKGCDWPSLREKTGTELTDFYIDVLRKLGKSPGVLGDIYAGAQSRFNNPVNLKRLISLIDETEWTSLGVDVKAAAYEGLLEKAASEGKKGAGQYFTPRVLIQSVVRCMKPDPRTHREFTVCDPACGTGGFLVAAYEWLVEQTKGGALDRDIVKRIKSKTYFGEDLVERPRRLALMNLMLHGMVFKILTEDCDLHTVLRLPRGTFTPYSQGVKANVVFFTKGMPTENAWIYDARTNVPGITKKDRPLSTSHFAEFETCYGSDPNGRAKRQANDSKEGRWRKFHISEVKVRDFKLDGFKWLKDESLEDSEELPEPEELVTDAIAELESAVEELNAVMALLENGSGTAATKPAK